MDMHYQTRRLYRLKLVQNLYEIGDISESEAFGRLSKPAHPFIDIEDDDSNLLKATREEVLKYFEKLNS